MSPRLAFALEAVVKAGKATLAHFQTGVEVMTKEDDSPVTVADREAERILRGEIERRYPEDAILGEEEGLTGSGENRWVIDPIDGTKSFLCGVPLYGTLLSFERSGEPEIAACYFPALNELLHAERGQGSQWNGRACQVSAREGLQGAVVSCGSLSAIEAKGLSRAFVGIAKRTMATRTWSDAYGHALVATGRIDAMVDPSVKRWDLSAIYLIVREAGGRFTDLKGREGIFDEAISSNGRIHRQLVEALRA